MTIDRVIRLEFVRFPPVGKGKGFGKGVTPVGVDLFPSLPPAGRMGYSHIPAEFYPMESQSHAVSPPAVPPPRVPVSPVGSLDVSGGTCLILECVYF